MRTAPRMPAGATPAKRAPPDSLVALLRDTREELPGASATRILEISRALAAALDDLARPVAFGRDATVRHLQDASAILAQVRELVHRGQLSTERGLNALGLDTGSPNIGRSEPFGHAPTSRALRVDLTA